MGFDVFSAVCSPARGVLASAFFIGRRSVDRCPSVRMREYNLTFDPQADRIHASSGKLLVCCTQAASSTADLPGFSLNVFILCLTLAVCGMVEHFFEFLSLLIKHVEVLLVSFAIFYRSLAGKFDQQIRLVFRIPK